MKAKRFYRKQEEPTDLKWALKVIEDWLKQRNSVGSSLGFPVKRKYYDLKRTK